MLVPKFWASCDPGDRYVGWCEWRGTQPIFVTEMSPEQTIERLESLVADLELLVFERWMLYAWNEKSLAGNEFRTAQMIGCLKYICSRSGIEIVGQYAREGKSTYKRAPFKHWSTRQWKAVLGGNIGQGHGRDAVAHGFELLRKRGYVPAA